MTFNKLHKDCCETKRIYIFQYDKILENLFQQAFQFKKHTNFCKNNNSTESLLKIVGIYNYALPAHNCRVQIKPS